MGLFVIEKNGKKIVGGKNKFVVDYDDLPEEIKKEDMERERLLREEQERKEAEARALEEARRLEEEAKKPQEKPVIYEKPKRGLFKRKEKKVKEKKQEIKEETPKQVNKIADKTSNLNNYVSNDRNYLNNITYANIDLENKEEDSSLYKGKLKTESTIFGICFKSILMSYLIFVLICGAIVITYYVLKRFDIFSLQLFKGQDMYTVEEFNNNNLRTMGILAGVTLVLSLISLLAIRMSVRSSLRKKYLSKINIYIYDVFIVVLNILFFVLIIMAIFRLIDNLHDQFAILVELKKIDGPVNIEAIEHFKMFIVIISSVILTLSSYFDVELIYKKNKFVFDDSVF